jgi:hypothetical protein
MTTVTVLKRAHFESGVFMTYSIKNRKEPIVEIYNLDKGYLVLGATTTGGYIRRTYKSEAAAYKWAQSYAKTFCRYYWDEVKIVPDL